MGVFGGFYKGDKKKSKKKFLERKAQTLARREAFVLPQVEIISKKRKNDAA